MSRDPNRVMIDIETLGLEPGAAILSIGAVTFDTDGIGATFERPITISSCQEHGLSIDADTLEWWLDQDEDAQHVLTGGGDLDESLAEFVAWYRGQNADEIWANSPSFDCTHLEAAFEVVGIETPWAFYQERDFRTLKELPVAVEIDHDGVEHDALDDAVHQARVAAATLKKLQEVPDGSR